MWESQPQSWDDWIHFTYIIIWDFFQNYPSLLSQAVYAAFCAAFPDSYKQFEDDFKEAVIGTVYEWIAGRIQLWKWFAYSHIEWGITHLCNFLLPPTTPLLRSSASTPLI